MTRCPRSPWLFALALGVADASAQPRIELTATPAWSGWTRPGRATEVDVRLSANVATRATLEVVAGRQSVRADVDLEPGRVERIHVPIESAEEVVVSAGAPAAAPQQRDVRIAQSEAPLLGVGLAGAEQVRLEDFHAVTLAAQDLPRNASAYESVDALVLDGATLRALDRRQLGALVEHAAACGRIALVNADPGVLRVLGGVEGCGGLGVMAVESPAQATAALKASLATRIAPQISLVGIRELAEPGRVAWQRIAVVVAAYFGLAAVAFALLRPSGLRLLLLPALAAIAVLLVVHPMQPRPQLVVWGEAESGAQVARYHAWQLFAGFVRARARTPVPPELGSVRPCDAREPMRLELDASRERVAFAEFDTRLFRQTALCYSGVFPLESALAVEARPDAAVEIRNAGSAAWPSGELIAGGLVHELPPLDPGQSAIVRTQAGTRVRDAPTRIAMAQASADRMAALWELQRADIGSGMERRGWLLLTAALP